MPPSKRPRRKKPELRSPKRTSPPVTLPDRRTLESLIAAIGGSQADVREMGVSRLCELRVDAAEIPHCSRLAYACRARLRGRWYPAPSTLGDALPGLPNWRSRPLNRRGNGRWWRSDGGHLRIRRPGVQLRHCNKQQRPKQTGRRQDGGPLDGSGSLSDQFDGIAEFVGKLQISVAFTPAKQK
jgi:hypothetical protein